MNSTDRMQDAVRYEVSQDLQQKSLGQFAVGRQSAARHRFFVIELSKLERCLDGIRKCAGELHAVNPFLRPVKAPRRGVSRNYTNHPNDKCRASSVTQHLKCRRPGN